MAAYTYFFADVLTDEVLGEFPATSCSYGESLNAEGRMSATGPLNAVDRSGVPLYTMLTLAPGRTAMYIDRGGVIVWAGLIWSGEADFGSEQLSLEGLGFLSIYRRRYVRRTLGASQITGPRIAANLIDYTESEGGVADFGMDTSGALAAGIGRDRTYYWYERKEIASAIVDLANLRGGFDFRFTATRIDESTIQKRLTTFYPATGRQTSIVFALGTNIEGLKVKVDATSLASRVDALGGGDAESMLYGTYSEVTSYPMYEDVISLGDEHSRANLIDHAARRVARGRGPIVAATVGCRGDDPEIGSYIAGDIVQLSAVHGWCNINGPMRVTGYDVRVDDVGNDSVEVSMVSTNAFDEFGH